MMDDLDKLIEAVIHELRGTCESLDSACDRNGIDPCSRKVTDALDSQIFNCAECGWWCEMHEEVSSFAGLDEWTCRQCAMENHGWDGEE